MKASIVMASFNGIPHLFEQLNSFLTQTILPDELIIVDDCSSDDTVTQLLWFANKSPFRVQILKNEQNLGSTKTFEKGLMLASGDIIFLSDQDDIWENTKIEKFISAFKSFPEAMLVMSDALIINDTGQQLSTSLWSSICFTPERQRLFQADREKVFSMLIRYSFVTGMTAAIRRNLLNLTIPIPDCWAHDKWLSLICAYNYRIALIPEKLVNYRVHSQQQIGVKKILGLKGLKRAIRCNFKNKILEYSRFLSLLEHFYKADRKPGLIEVFDMLKERGQLLNKHINSLHKSRIARLGMHLDDIVSGKYHRCLKGFNSFFLDIMTLILKLE